MRRVSVKHRRKLLLDIFCFMGYNGIAPTGEVTTTTQVRAAPNVHGRCLADIFARCRSHKKEEVFADFLFFYSVRIKQNALILYNSPYPFKATLFGGALDELTAGTSALQNLCFVQFGNSFPMNSKPPFGLGLRVSF